MNVENATQQDGNTMRETQSMLLERIASEMNRLKFYMAHAQVSITHLLFSFFSCEFTIHHFLVHYKIYITLAMHSVPFNAQSVVSKHRSILILMVGSFAFQSYLFSSVKVIMRTARNWVSYRIIMEEFGVYCMSSLLGIKN